MLDKLYYVLIRIRINVIIFLRWYYEKKFTTTLDDEIIKQAKIKAIEEGISVAELIEKILKEYLKK